MRHDKRRRDIKSKLMAAICMLLVSSIMMVSTTYAWFTLSTAPEVTGINTSVGANGNLEMALLGTQGSFANPDTNIVSGTTDSMSVQDAFLANQTWGNLVDLSDEAYGLNNVVLMPAALNLTPTGDTILDQMLSVPQYGSDGRVSNLTADNTIAAPYSSTSSSFAAVATDAAADTIRYGVRGIGVSSNRSAREASYSSNLSKAAGGLATIRSKASATLTDYAPELANIAMLYKMKNQSTFAADDVKVVWDVIDAILGKAESQDDEGDTLPAVEGIVDIAEETLEYYAKAAFASNLNTTKYADDAAWETALTDEYPTWKQENSEVIAATTAITAVQNAAEAAADGLGSYDPSGTYEWNTISGALRELFDANAMKVCGLTLDQAMTDGEPNITLLLEKYNEYGRIVVDMNAGAFAVIANLVDNYSTMGQVNIEIPGMGPLPCVINAQKTQNTDSAVLTTFGATLANNPAPKGTASNPTISDLYGYVIDLAFRTNASGSNLLLQTDEIQRISGSTSEETMGGGSTVTFNSMAGFTGEQMLALMPHVKIVFFNSADNKILATANIDTTSITATANTTKITAPIKLEGDTDVIYANMPANTAVTISALVYLDGTSVSNGHVGIGASSMYGTLNLQFASSANLVPMKYSEFTNANTAG